MTRRFQVRHPIHATSERFWRVIHHGKEFMRTLYIEELGYGYEIREDNKETGVRRTYITPKVDAPAAIVRVMGDSISFEEQGKLGPGPRYEFRVVPNKFTDKIDISGAMTTEPRGEGECDRVVDFEVTCGIFGIGGIVERFVEKEIVKGYNDSAGFTNDFLAKNP